MISTLLFSFGSLMIFNLGFSSFAAAVIFLLFELTSGTSWDEAVYVMYYSVNY